MSDGAPNWLVMVAQLPTEEPAFRMRVLRTLESLGAAVIREGAYLLPHTPANRQALDALADYIAKNAGTAHVLPVAALPSAQHESFARLFDRSARYDALIKTVESLRVGFGHSDPSAISRVLHKQRREYEAIAALDFFPTEMQAKAHEALASGEAAVRKLLFPGQAGAAAVDTSQGLLRRTWATRKPLWADRLACGWLIRRFVDPEATLMWLEKGESAPKDAIGFGYEGAAFGMGEDRVTYENLLARFDLARNSALARIGALVRYLEIQGTPVAEAAGVQTLLQGAVRRSGSEQELLLEAEKTFDLLYEAYLDTAKTRA
jgi:hypothetical protein